MVLAALIAVVLAAPAAADSAVTGELTRLHLSRRSFFVKTGSPPREVEVRVEPATEIWARGRRAALLDLRPGDRVSAEFVLRRRVRHAVVVRTAAPSSGRGSASDR